MKIEEECKDGGYPIHLSKVSVFVTTHPVTSLVAECGHINNRQANDIRTDVIHLNTSYLRLTIPPY